MARKLVRGDPVGSPRGDSAGTTEGPRGRVRLRRRDFVTLGAIGMVGLGSLSQLSTVSGSRSEPYETITLDSGEQRAIDLEDGDVLENVLIDQTARDSMLAVRVAEDADDWAIRNVGWKGVAPSGGGDREYTFLIHARGDGVIENVFIDQRSHDGGKGSDIGGIWTYSNSHDGHIDCRHNFIAGCGNNASYPSGDGWEHNSSTGTVSHYRSYHRDNTVSNFRPGRPGCTIRECVSVVNDPDGTRGGYPSSGSQLTRAIWGWHNAEMRMEGCAIWHDPDDIQPAAPFWATWRNGSNVSSGDFCELEIRDTHINPSWRAAGNPLVDPDHGGSSNDKRRVVIENLGDEPTVEILGEGVPTTPEMAARGERTLPPALGTSPGGGHGNSLGERDEGGNTDSAVGHAGESNQPRLSQYRDTDEPTMGLFGRPDVDSNDTGDDTSPPRLGVAGGLAGVGGMGYMVIRRFQEDY